MTDLLLVGLGGATGAISRYLTTLAFLRWIGPERPYLATLAINVLGSLVMGLLMGSLTALPGPGSERLRLLVGVGLIGGFTTFSAFSLEAVSLLERRQVGEAAGYIVASLLLSMAALILGLALARRSIG